MLSNRIRLFVAVAIVMSLLSFPAAAAAQTGRSWESGEFGYVVDFERDWEIDEDNTGVNEGVDVLQLLNTSDGLVLQVMFIPIGAEIADPAEAIDFYTGGVLADPTADEVVSSRPGDDPWWLGEIEVEGEIVQVYVEGRELDDAILLVVVLALDGDAAGALDIVADTVTLDGDDLLETFGVEGEGPANGTDEPASGGGATEEGDYVAWTHPIVHLSFDPELWAIKDDLSAEDTDSERDLLILIYDDPDVPAAIYVETYDDYNGDPVDCLETALEEGVGDATTRGLDDDNGDPIEGEEDDRAWSAVSYRNADGDRLATYVDCRVLPDGEGVVVVSFFTARSDFDDLYPDALDIVDSIEFVEDDGRDNGSTTNASSAGGVLEFEDFAIQLTYDEDLFIGSMSDEGVATLVTEGAIMFFVSALANDGSLTAADCSLGAALLYTGQPADLELAENADGETVAGTEGDTTFGLFTYTNGREDWMVITSCTTTPEDDGYLLIVGLAPAEMVEPLLESYVELSAGIEPMAG